MTTAIIITLIATNWIAISAYILLLDRFRKCHFDLQKIKKDHDIKGGE